MCLLKWSLLHNRIFFVLVNQHLWPCTGCWLYLLRMKWFMFGTLFLHKSTYLYEKRIGQVTSDLFYMRFPYYTKDNQQGCSTLSNWFSLRCLGPWLTYLPITEPLFVWWSVGMEAWCGGEGFFSWFLAFIYVLYITHVLPIIFPLKLIYSQFSY